MHVRSILGKALHMFHGIYDPDTLHMAERNVAQMKLFYGRILLKILRTIASGFKHGA